MSLGGKTDNYFYHFNLNPREDEPLTPEQLKVAVATTLENLGLEDQPYFLVEHDKDGRSPHFHCIVLRVDLDSGKAISDSHDYAIHQRTADQLEQLFAHERTNRERGPDGPNPKGHEAQRGKETGIDPKDVAAELKDLWQHADSGQAFAAALEERGYILADGDRGFVVIDRAGGLHSVARRVGARLAEVNARMADIDLEVIPTVAEARALARERAAERRERSEAPPADVPDPAESREKSAAVVTDDSAPAPDPSVPAPAEKPGASENIVYQAAEIAKEVVPLLAELSEAAETHDAPAELAALARFALDKAKESPAPEYVPITRARPSLFARAAQKAADAIRFLRGERTAAPSVDRPAQLAQPRPDAPHPSVAPAAAASQHRPAHADPAAFEQLTADRFEALRAVAGDGHFMHEAIDWQAGETGTPLFAEPHQEGPQAAFEHVTQENFSATRDNGGEPVTGDGTSFWQRAIAAMTEAYERAAEWVRDTAQGFVGRLMQERARAKDNHQRER